MLYFNELSCNFRTDDENDAFSTLTIFFDACVAFQKRRHIKKLDIISTIKFSQIYFSDKFNFSIWVDRLSKERKRQVLAMLGSVPLVREFPPYYFCNQEECIGLGLAYENDGFSVSFPYPHWRDAFIAFQKIEADRTEDVNMKHIAQVDHVEMHFPQRIFEHHLKHDKFRLNRNDGQSTLWYNMNVKGEIDHVQKLLDLAQGDGKLFVLDNDLGLFIEFQPTGGNANIYHGYHILDDNRVPDWVRKLFR